jgi:ATP-dependent exoDNAse (exonuclease V) beta subunit
MSILQKSGDNQIKRGIIDLLVIDDLYITIIDFKLKNINDLAYDSQLKGYYGFLKDKLKKPFRLYLYSIMNRDLKKVEL